MKYNNILILILTLIILVELGFLFKNTEEHYRYYREEGNEDEDEDEDVFEDVNEILTDEEEEKEKQKTIYNKVFNTLASFDTEKLNGINNITNLESIKDNLINYYSETLPLLSKVNISDIKELQAYYDFNIMQIDNKIKEITEKERRKEVEIDEKEIDDIKREIQITQQEIDENKKSRNESNNLIYGTIGILLIIIMLYFVLKKK